MNAAFPTATNADFAKPWRLTVLVAAVFVVVVGVAMIAAQLQHKSSDPWKAPALLKLKEQLRAEPKNDALKQQIRELDLKLRQRYFRLLALKASGLWLLLGGAMVLVIAGGQVRRSTRQPPMPQSRPNAAAELAAQTRQSRVAVATCGAVAVVAFGALGFAASSTLPRSAAELDKLFAATEGEAAPATDCASLEELSANWPGFRGFGGSGVAPFTNAPTNWEGETALWRTRLDSPGFSSPIVFGGRVFLTSGDATKREVICFDAATGALLWRQAVGGIPGSPAELPEIPDMTSHAPNTAATDGRRVYAMFATGEIVAFTLDGQRVWAKHLGVPKNPYGHATSLAMWRDKVVVLLDQGEPEDRLSKLILLDGCTGVVLWEKLRPVGASWASPIVVEAAGKTQIITLALPWVIAYDVANGTELWRAEALEGEVTPSPVFAGGLVFVVSPSARLLAVRPDGSGDVTKSHVAWSVEEYLPDISSPVSNGELVFTVTSGGLLACFDAKDGKKLWEHDFEAEVHASPSLVGGTVLIVGNKGDVIGAAAGREFKELFRVKLEDEFQASPAFADGKVILRGAKDVWCFGEKK
jgi:outer membrane protein assembly factor BamB